jgi:hypothetical protein
MQPEIKASTLTLLKPKLDRMLLNSGINFDSWMFSPALLRMINIDTLNTRCKRFMQRRLRPKSQHFTAQIYQ